LWVEIIVTQDGAVPNVVGESDLANAVVPPGELGPNWTLDDRRQSETTGKSAWRYSVYGALYRNVIDFAPMAGGRKIGVRLWTHPNASAAESGTFSGVPFGLPFLGKPEKVAGWGDGVAYRRSAPGGQADPLVPILIYSYRVGTVVVAVGVWEGDADCHSTECDQGISTNPGDFDSQARDFARRQTDRLRAVLASRGLG
jgi:hypothetical protein